MKILLIATNRHREPLLAFPLGVAYLAGNINKKKHSVKVLDLMFEEDFKESVAATVDEFSPDLIGLSIRNTAPNNVSSFPEIMEIIKICRKAEAAKIVLGGTGFSIMPMEIMRHLDADFGVLGEGITPFNLLLDSLTASNNPDDIPGLIWKDHGKILINEPNKNENLDDFKPPDWKSFDYKNYEQKGLFAGIVIVKRGCPFENLWDDTPREEGKTLRLREPSKVADELEMMNNELGFSTLTLVASKLNYPLEYAESLCREIISRKLSIAWFGDIHPSFSSESLFKLMKQAGCALVYIDVGSCSEKMLRSMGANFTPDDIRKCCSDLKKAELDFGFLMHFGAPGESKDTVEETLAFIDEIKPAMVSGGIGLRIYPNTPIAEIAEREGVILKNQDLYERVIYVEEKVKDWIFDYMAEASQEREGFTI